MRAALFACVLVAGCGSGSGSGGSGESEVDAYKRKAKETEGRLQLNRMSKFLRVIYTETSSFPKGSTGLTPSKPCCQEPGQTCAPSPATWEHEVWKALDFTVDDPYRFQYSYESTDGQTFTAKAVGDVACTGKSTTFTITGKVGPNGPEVDTSQIR